MTFPQGLTVLVLLLGKLQIPRHCDTIVLDEFPVF
jgi:hypothetical protein